MQKINLAQQYRDVISMENLLEAWQEFVRGKRSRIDVQKFQRNLMTNIISLHQDLSDKTYKHSSYEAFGISDPKPRSIHKASVRDRLLHHALYRKLYPFFDRTFIADSYSCRNGKGTHKAIDAFQVFARKESQNHTKTVWVLKCDIKKFFASVDQRLLLEAIEKYVPDQDIMWLISEIVRSFNTTRVGVGLPLGNLTSQLLVNIYMNEFDQFVKHRIKAGYYIRYADDFAFISQDRKWLEQVLPMIKGFLYERLHLIMHPDKIVIKTVASGVDFLGWVHFPYHRVLRTVTKRRMFKRIKVQDGKMDTVQSYLGLISHGNTRKLRRKVEAMVHAITSP